MVGGNKINMSKVLKLLFIIPLLVDLTNIQNILSVLLLGNETIIRFIAYGNIIVLTTGLIILLNRYNLAQYHIPGLSRLWIAFFMIYFIFALFANIYHETDPYDMHQIIITFLFFFSYTLFFLFTQNITLIIRVLMFGFFLTSILNILFHFLNFSLDHGGITIFKLERGGGVYGDANNSALASLLAFIFLNYSIKTTSITEKALKALAMGICVYSLYISFSKTSLIIFPLVFALAFFKDFDEKKIRTLIFTLPLLILGVTHAFSRINISEEQKERIFSILNLITLETSKVDFSERDVLLANMLNKINESPVIGWGVQFSNEIRGHNTIIGVWADAGFIVFIFFLILLFSFMNGALKQKKNTRYFSISVLACVYIYMLSLQTIINQPYIIVLFSLLSSLYYLTNPDTLLNINKLKIETNNEVPSV
jgi:hypothetical protein